MRKSGQLRSGDVRAIWQLAGECRELGDERLVWREHWVSRVAALTGSDLGHFGEMAGCRVLKPVDLGVACWGWQSGFTDPSVVQTHLKEFRSDPGYSPAMIEHLRRHAAEPGVCLSRREVVPDRAWYASADFQVVQRAFGVDHILWCFRPISGAGPDECSGVVLNREKNRRDFSARDRELVREASALVAPLIGGPLARFADPSPLDLAPRAREVLACLLEGDGDKQIAGRLGLAAHTVNEYTKVIYRHFGVRGRSELMARWIRRGWGKGLSWVDSHGPRPDPSL